MVLNGQSPEGTRSDLLIIGHLEQVLFTVILGQFYTPELW